MPGKNKQNSAVELSGQQEMSFGAILPCFRLVWEPPWHGSSRGHVVPGVGKNTVLEQHYPWTGPSVVLGQLPGVLLSDL